VNQVHPDVPLDRAWQVGRRVYVKAAKYTQLDDELYRLGAKWDAEAGARWVGSTKKQAVVELLTSLKPEPLAADVPLAKAWRCAARIYVRCGERSKLGEHMNGLGARWDRDAKAVWVDARYVDTAVKAIRDAAEREAFAVAVKAQDHWLEIPYDAEHVRDAAKKAGALFDGPTKRWAFPTEDALRRVEEARDVWITETEEAGRLEGVAAEEARQARFVEQAARRRVSVLDASGRNATGETVEHREVTTQFLNRAGAERAARPEGSVLRLRDGRRGLVVGVKVWFTNDEDASSVCWHPETHDEAHWDFSYQVAVVEDTAEEKAADAEQAAQQADALAIHAVLDRAHELTGATAGDRWSKLPDDVVGQVEATSGVAAVVRGGTLTLTGDGRVVWQHPGWYDDYVRSEGVSSDPELAARVRAILAAGPRKRVVSGPAPIYYAVTVRGA
jgi:hypothetical protein